MLSLDRVTHLHEDAHRCRGNGSGAMPTSRSAALNLLGLAGSIDPHRDAGGDARHHGAAGEGYVQATA